MIDLCINGYASLWGLVKFIFYSKYLAYERCGLEPSNALGAFLKRKDTFPIFWSALYT